MTKSCCAYNCTNRFKKGNGVAFHRFPFSKSGLLKKWISSIRRENFSPNIHTYVCSTHFAADCFYENHRSKRILKEDAVPTIFEFPKHLKKGSNFILKYFKMFSRHSVYCKFGGCKNNSGMNLKGLRFYRFPKDEKRCQIWIKACQNKMLEGISASKHYDSSRICSDHFQDWCFINSTTKHRLVHNAIPNSPKPPPIQVRDMTYISCSIPGCLSKSHREIKHSTAVGEKHILMFPVPHADDGLFNKWKEAFKEAEIELTGDDHIFHICEHHFLENDIERHCRIKMRNDDIIEIPKKFPTLKPDAVPMKFLKPSCLDTSKDTSEKTLNNDIERHHRIKMPDDDIIEIPKNLPTMKPDAVPMKFLKPSCLVTKDSSEKTLPVSKNSILKFLLLKSEQSSSYNSNLTLNFNDSEDSIVGSDNETFSDPAMDSVANPDDSSVNSVQEQISHTKKCLPYSELVENIQLVKKPSEFWSVVCTYQFTIFARWNSKFIPEKRLVIENPLTVRVFLKDWEIEMTDLVDITSVDDISSLLEKVEDYKLDLTC